MRDSGLDFQAPDRARIGVTIGSAVGATMGLEEEYVVLSDSGRKWLVDAEYGVPHLYGHFVPSSIASEVAWSVGAEGPRPSSRPVARLASTRSVTPAS